MKKPKYIPEFKDIPTERQKMPELELDKRTGNFDEVELGFTEEMALAEAVRCLSCRRCIGCGLCLAECDPQAVIYDETSEKITLEADSIIITSTLISVSGAVYDPGSYPFIPGKGYSYYVGLAGGIDPERNNFDRVKITDSDGKARSRDESIEPGDKIFVRTNKFVYNFNRYFPLLTAGVAFTASVLNLIALFTTQ